MGERPGLCSGRVRRGSSRVADQGTEAGQCLGAGPVVDPDAALLAVQQAAFVQHLEVVADGRLGQVERAGQVAHAGLAAGVGGDQGHQPEPDRVGERLEQRRDLLGLLCGQRPLRQRRAARHQVGLPGGQEELRPGVAAHGRLGGAEHQHQTSACIYIDRVRCLMASSAAPLDIDSHRSRRSPDQEVRMSASAARPQRQRHRGGHRVLQQAVRHRAGQDPARLRQLRHRRAAAETGPAGEPWPGRQPSITSASRSPTPTRSTRCRPV